MKKHISILIFVAFSMLIMQSCNLPFQDAVYEDVPQEGLPPENGAQEEHPLEGLPIEEQSPEEVGEVQIVFFQTDRTAIRAGECAMLEWNVQGSPWVTLNGDPVEPSGLQEVCPSETASYRLAVDAGTQILERETTIVVEGVEQSSPANQQTQSAQVQPQSDCAGPPTISSFVVNPSTITAGQSTTLSWGTVTNGSNGSLVKSVMLEPGFGEVGSPGSRVVQPKQTITYTLKGSGCGGTTTKQVIVVVNSGQPAQSGADLALTDLYPQNLPKGEVFARITNNGPDSLSNAKADLKCTAVAIDYNTGIKTTQAKAYPVSITLDLNPGQTKAFGTGILIDTSKQWYEFECNVYTQNSNDPKTNNNSFSETFPPPP